MAKARSSETSLAPRPLEQEVQRLKDELWRTRDAIIGLMPGQVRDILSSHYKCNTRAEVVRWMQETAEKIVSLAQPQSAEEMGDYGSSPPRARCPLCGEGSINPFGIEGFAFPEGLFRHLEGTYNARQCPVFRVAYAAALDYVNETSWRPR